MSDPDSSRVDDPFADGAAPAIEHPPQRIGGIMRQLGPGVILAASIVGSGELIATTKTGAQAGFYLLWLIVIGCVIKIFAQVEFGRYAISTGKATMAALDEVPGPRFRANWLVRRLSAIFVPKRRQPSVAPSFEAHWILWYWLVMFVVGLAQLGGIVGGVGQALAINAPLNGSFNELLSEQKDWDVAARPLQNQLRAQEAAALASDDPQVCGKRLSYRRSYQADLAACLQELIVLLPAHERCTYELMLRQMPALPDYQSLGAAELIRAAQMDYRHKAPAIRVRKFSSFSAMIPHW